MRSAGLAALGLLGLLMLVPTASACSISVMPFSFVFDALDGPDKDPDRIVLDSTSGRRLYQMPDILTANCGGSWLEAVDGHLIVHVERSQAVVDGTGATVDTLGSEWSVVAVDERSPIVVRNEGLFRASSDDPVAVFERPLIHGARVHAPPIGSSRLHVSETSIVALGSLYDDQRAPAYVWQLLQFELNGTLRHAWNWSEVGGGDVAFDANRIGGANDTHALIETRSSGLILVDIANRSSSPIEGHYVPGDAMLRRVADELVDINGSVVSAIPSGEAVLAATEGLVILSPAYPEDREWREWRNDLLWTSVCCLLPLAAVTALLIRRSRRRAVVPVVSGQALDTGE